MRFNARRASRRRHKLELRHDRARRRACVRPNRAGRGSPSSATSSRPVRLRGPCSNSLPGAAAKADPPAAGEEQPVPSNDTARDEPSGGQTGRHSLLNDSALLSALPFALRAASTMNERRQAADSSPSLASPAMKGPKSESSGASLVAGGKAATVGRLVGERAFHFGAPLPPE